MTGAADVDGRLIHLASQDFTVLGGAAGEVHCSKIVEMMIMSLKTGTPFVFINDSGGARVQEGIDSLDGYARVFYETCSSRARFRRSLSSAARAPAEQPTAPR